MELSIKDFSNVSKCFAYTCYNENIEHFYQMLTSLVNDASAVEKHPMAATLADVQTGTRRIRSDTHALLYSQVNCTNSVVFLIGGCGIGQKSTSYYGELFSKMDELCNANNINICMLRGGNDIIKAFHAFQGQYGHIHLLDDYTITKVANVNILSIGGCIPLNREPQSDSGPIFQKELLRDIMSDMDIACVVSQTNPTFVTPYFQPYSSPWFEDNEGLYKASLSAHQTMDAIYGVLIEGKTLPLLWLFPNESGTKTSINTMLFKGVEHDNFYDIGRTMAQKGFKTSAESLAAEALSSSIFTRTLGDPIFVAPNEAYPL